MTNQATVRSTGTSISTNSSTSTLENASIVRTLFDLFFYERVCQFVNAYFQNPPKFLSYGDIRCITCKHARAYTRTCASSLIRCANAPLTLRVCLSAAPSQRRVPGLVHWIASIFIVQKPPPALNLTILTKG